MNTYKIYPIYQGTSMLCSSSVYYKSNAQKEPNVPMPIISFALKCNETGEVVMIDCGNVSEEDFKPYEGHCNPGQMVPGAPTFKEGLNKLEIDPKEVKTCIITHLHMDHSFYMYLFENAKFYVQRAELEHAVAPTPIEYGSYQHHHLPGFPCWHKVWGSIVPVDGDKKIMDGIKVWHCSSHTPGSQIVIVNTMEGEYVFVGDIFYNMEQYNKGRMLGNFTDLFGWYKTLDRVREYCAENNAKILCSHDEYTLTKEVWG